MNCAGMPMTFEYSLVGDTTGCDINGKYNQLNVDAKVSMPALNGAKFISTAAIAADSPAIGKGDTLRCEHEDARQILRTNDAGSKGVTSCDIGSFQFHPDIDSGKQDERAYKIQKKLENYATILV